MPNSNTREDGGFFILTALLDAYGDIRNNKPFEDKLPSYFFESLENLFVVKTTEHEGLIVFGMYYFLLNHSKTGEL